MSPLCLNDPQRRGDEAMSMKPEEMRAMSSEQLNLTLKDTIKNLFHLRCQSATERLETPSEIRKAKREVARIKTIQRERELGRDRRATGAEAMTRNSGTSGQRRTEVGVVTSDKMNKTRRVEIPRLVKHPRYGKYIRRRTICNVHDEQNESHKGDTVEIMETPAALQDQELARWCAS